MQINGFQKTTLLDYPGHLAATVFLGGCDFYCPFCHNGSLVLPTSTKTLFTEEEILTYLKKRCSILEGVCITGGEPALQTDLPHFIRNVKALGLKVKLDTNGNHAEMLQELIQEGLLDYIAMDIKNSKAKYSLTAGKKELNLDTIEKSITLIMNSNITYEFRTTVVKEFHALHDFEEIGQWIRGAAQYYLQCYRPSDNTIRPGLSACSRAELEQIKDIMTSYVQIAGIRGID